MGHCGLTDADLEVIMAYAAKDTMLRRVVINNNQFEVSYTSSSQIFNYTDIIATR